MNKFDPHYFDLCTVLFKHFVRIWPFLLFPFFLKTGLSLLIYFSCAGAYF